jgi:hypothetical protein
VSNNPSADFAMLIRDTEARFAAALDGSDIKDVAAMREFIDVQLNRAISEFNINMRGLL